jgi:hypothetical protein
MKPNESPVSVVMVNEVARAFELSATAATKAVAASVTDLFMQHSPDA